MYCKKCGTQLPEDASFCLKCGTPQVTSVQAQTGTTQWEFCEITWEYAKYDWSRFSGTIRFWAKSVGPNGTKNVGETERVPGTTPTNWVTQKDRQVMLDAVDGLKAKLLGDGWEPMGQGFDWYNQKFRRRVN